MFQEIQAEIEKYKNQREELTRKHRSFLQKREELSGHMAELDKEVFRLENQKESYEEASQKQFDLSLIHILACVPDSVWICSLLCKQPSGGTGNPGFL